MYVTSPVSQTTYSLSSVAGNQLQAYHLSVGTNPEFHPLIFIVGILFGPNRLSQILRAYTEINQSKLYL